MPGKVNYTRFWLKTPPRFKKKHFTDWELICFSAFCWIYIFFLPWTYPVNSVFSVILGIYNIHVLINIFSSLQLLLQWVRKSLFPISMATVVKEKFSFNTIIELISSNYPRKNGAKQTKTTQRCKGVSSTPLLRT